MSSTRRRSCLLFSVFSVSLWLVPSSHAEPLPGTKPLEEKGDLARKMVDGIHIYLDRELAAAPKHRDAVKPDRERLRKLLGVVDQRSPTRVERIAPLTEPFGDAPLAELVGCDVSGVRWAVLPGVDAVGTLIQPLTKAKAVVIDLWHPDGDAARLARDVTLARQGCLVLAPLVLDRRDDFSGSNTPHLKRQTNQPHREFVYRMAYEMGRSPLGYEVQGVLAAVDALRGFDGNAKLPLGVIGDGDGGRVALYAAALDDRVSVCQVVGAFGPQEEIERRPIDRNVWGLLTEFGDAEVGALIAPRKLLVDTTPGPTWGGPAAPKPGRAGAAPGTLAPVPDADVEREFARLKRLAGNACSKADPLTGASANTDAFLTALGLEKPARQSTVPDGTKKLVAERLAAWREKQVGQLVSFTQKLWRDSDATRKAYWSKADAKSPEAWDQSCDAYRRYFHEEVIGKLPAATVPMNPKSRVVYDEPKWTGYEVTLDLYPDVFASGMLLLPKGMTPGEKRPVVVCQHGLEGRPVDVCNPREVTKYYASFGARLADLGYIVYAPQNPYIFMNHFRQAQRKANPLKLSLFSFIIAQHKTTIDWLETLPNVDAKRIGFYGLSYGGKTAMRVPAVEKRYALSICSGDFNEWVGKNVSVDLDRSYMWTGEYEMFEFDLGNTFNYAEMAYLIAPRPFMVERGHDDGVGTDEMVSYEFARVRYLYANRLKIPDRTTIEYRVGGHEIFLKGTLAFIEQHLGKPK